MSEKKNIDRLFQEKFKDFEADPPEYVWDNIHDALQEKKKRRVIPLWWRYGGVAAILVLGTLFTLPYIGGLDSNQNQVVTSPQHKQGEGKTITAPRVIQDDADGSSNNAATDYNNDAVAGTEKSGTEGNHTSGKGKNSTAKHGTISTPNKAIINSADNNAIVSTGSKANSIQHKVKSNKRTNSAINPANESAVAAATNRGKIKGRNNNNGAAGSNTASTGGADLNRAGQSINNNEAQTPNNQTAIVENQTAPNAQNKHNSSGVNDNMAVISSPADHAMVEAIIDTTKIKPENELEKLLKEQQEKKKDEQVADNSQGKWSIKPQLAPVFYNSLSQGSPIDAQFATNSKSYDTDLSVGLGVNYAINNRLRIRSGVNMVNLNYSTQGVEFYASLNGGTNNVSATAKSANIVVQDQGSMPSVNPTNAFSSQLSSNNAFEGSMVQQTGYVELPVEMSYALIDKKFGIAVIGGVSTLFLNQNNVNVVSNQGLSTRVGEAENLNNIHFSTNVGLGFRYRFFKSFEASFEPTFKYQVNTFSRDAGNFKPYFVGLYSGISFSF